MKGEGFGVGFRVIFLGGIRWWLLVVGVWTEVGTEVDR